MGGSSPARAKLLCSALALSPVFWANDAVVQEASGYVRISSMARLTTAADDGCSPP